MGLRHHIANLVHSAGDEIHELKLSHRTHSSKRRTKSRANNRRLSNRRIDHTFWPEAINEAVSNLKCAAVNANIFTQTEDGGITLHLFPDSLADGFEISKVRHEFNT